MWPGIAAARIDAAIVWNGLECSEKFGARFGYLETRDICFGKGKGQF
jgi:hypothetical protein